jgi:hypothetical protein
MDETHLKVLDDIHKFLLLPHSIQALVSSERTPTSAVALPTYEFFLQSMYQLVNNNTFPHLTHAICQAIDKIEKYVEIARKNRVYGMSMCEYSPPMTRSSTFSPLSSSHQPQLQKNLDDCALARSRSHSLYGCYP